MGQLDRDALNQAFWDLGLRFQWDEALWQALAAFPDLNARMRTTSRSTSPTSSACTTRTSSRD